jgi:putative ubiquitin-RnfH superfamily antitoxin RatB of RatAB toxin-antitoxin module
MKYISVSIVYATPEKQWIKECTLPRGSCVEDLVKHSELLCEIPELNGRTVDTLQMGVYAAKVTTDTLLEEGDRLEIYRPLQADPKEVRRQLALLGKTMGNKTRA